MNRTVLILPFYGSLPWYFNFFLKSLDGVKLDVLFVSDLIPNEYPPNFKLLDMEIKALEDLVNSKLNTNITFKNSYKLCDFKPMYGKIFEDYIKRYDYWAFGDCDLIYGKSLNMVLDDIENSDWDIASFRKKWISGGFCLLKNVDRINNLFRGVRTLGEMLTCENYDYFDEIGGNWFDDLESGRISLEDCAMRRDSFSSLVWRTSDIRLFHEDLLCEDPVKEHIVYMDEGNLKLDAKSVPIFHYINAKHLGRFTGKERPYHKIKAYRVTWQGHFCSDTEWALRRLISFNRNIRLHARAYGNLMRKRGFMAFVRHIAGRVLGLKGLR